MPAHTSVDGAQRPDQFQEHAVQSDGSGSRDSSGRLVQTAARLLPPRRCGEAESE